MFQNTHSFSRLQSYVETGNYSEFRNDLDMHELYKGLMSRVA